MPKKKKTEEQKEIQEEIREIEQIEPEEEEIEEDEPQEIGTELDDNTGAAGDHRGATGVSLGVSRGAAGHQDKVLACDFIPKVYMVNPKTTALFLLKKHDNGTFVPVNSEPLFPTLTREYVLLRWGPGKYQVVAKNIKNGRQIFSEFAEIFDTQSNPSPPKRPPYPNPEEWKGFYYPPYSYPPEYGPYFRPPFPHKQEDLLDKLIKLSPLLIKIIEALRPQTETEKARSLVELLAAMREKELEYKIKELEIMKEQEEIEEEEEPQPEIDPMLLQAVQEGNEEAMKKVFKQILGEERSAAYVDLLWPFLSKYFKQNKEVKNE